MVLFHSSPVRRASVHRSSGRRRPLGLEGLESRQMLSGDSVIETNPWSVVVAASDIGPQSTPLVSVVDSVTGSIERQFLAYESTFRGGVRVAVGDVNGDNVPDIITAPGAGRVGEVRVFDLIGTEMVAYRTLPFGPAWRGGVEVASGDVDGNGRDDIVASQSRGRGEVRVFASVDAADPIVDAATRTIVPFGPRFNGGSTVAVADVGTFTGGALTNATTPDGRVELVVGNGSGARSLVRVYDVSAAPRVVATVQPFPASVRGGVAITSGRVSADTIDEIIVSAGRGGSGAVEIYDGRIGLAPGGGLTRVTAAFAAFARPQSPITVAPMDTNGDGRIERLFVAQGDPRTGFGIASYTTNGVFIGQAASLAGPLRIAAPRAPGDVVTTPSGLKYRDLAVGTGPQPTSGQRITAHYTGTLVDGTVFDSSRARGTPFQFTLGVGQVIAGWDEAFATMRVGGRRILIIPPELAYGNVARPGIPAGSTLIFDVELLAIG